MNIQNKILIITITVLVLSCNEKAADRDKVKPPLAALLSPTQIQDNMLQKGIVWVDARSRDHYNKGHIEGAVNMSRRELVNSEKNYPGIKAAAKELETMLEHHGITADDTLVIYDDGGSADACRLWWLLAHYGFDNTSILNGGLKAWLASGGALSHTPTIRKPSTFTWEKPGTAVLWIDKDDLLNVVENPNSNATIIDVRSEEEYHGKRQRKGTNRFGHIPGSRNIDWVQAIDSEDQISFREISELESLYKGLGNKDRDTVILYCHSGVRSSHTTFIISKLLGYKNVFNYDGSWAEWSYFKELPIESETLLIQ